MTARARVALVAALLTLTACSDNDVPAAPDPSGPQTPGDPSTMWEAIEPEAAVDPGDVQTAYDDVLDDAEATLSDLAWTTSSPLRTQEFEGVCAVTLERSAPGALPPPGDDTLDLSALTAALEAEGFADLAMADDPGGAVRYLAQDGDGALFELRSKDTTTLAVRVPTTAASCS